MDRALMELVTLCLWGLGVIAVIPLLLLRFLGAIIQNIGDLFRGRSE